MKNLYRPVKQTVPARESTSAKSLLVGVAVFTFLMVLPGFSDAQKVTMSDGDWNSITWSPAGVPIPTDNVIINHAVSLTGNADCNNITIGLGGSLTLENGSSFIPKGTVSGTISVKCALTGGSNYHLISLPISEGVNPAYPFFDNAYLDSYSETTGAWNRLVNANTVPANQGYSINYAGNTVLTFAGTINSSNFTFSGLTYTNGVGGYGPGWNLVGNPFSTTIKNNSGTWSKTNIDSYIYVWNGSQYLVAPILSGYGTLGNFIAAMQGFFIHATTDAIIDGAELVIGQNTRVHNSTTFYKDEPVLKDVLFLGIEGNNYNDKAIVAFNSLATEGFDGDYDAYKLPGIDEAPQLYSILPTEKATVNSLPSIASNPNVSLGLKVGAETTYTLSITGMESFDANVPIRLDDLKTGTSQDVRQQPSLSFTSAPGDPENRFRLRFTSALKIDEDLAGKYNIYAIQNDVFVKSSTFDKGTVSVYSASGQMVAQQLLNNGEASMKISTPGFYLVKVVTGNSFVSGKVIVK